MGTVGTMTLTDFLLARIAEDETEAKTQWPDDVGPHLSRCALNGPDHMQVDDPWCDCGYPARVLTDCEAKRRVVTLMGYVRESWENRHAGEGRVMWPDVNRREKMHALTILETLAVTYADHPDFREEWRP